MHHHITLVPLGGLGGAGDAHFQQAEGNRAEVLPVQEIKRYKKVLRSR